MDAGTATATQTLQQLVEIYGGGPLAALIIATPTFVAAAMFLLLVRSWSVHLKDVRQYAALADKMSDAIEGNSRVLERALEQLRGPGRRQRQFTPPPPEPERTG